MTGSRGTAISSAVADADLFPLDYLEGRASLVLKLLAAVNVAGMVLDLFPGIAVESILQTVTFNIAAGGLAVIYFITARSIDRHRAWAITAARPLLVFILLLGAYWVVSGFAAGKTRIPFEVVMAIWALLGAAAVKPIPRFDRRSAGTSVATALLMLSMVFGRQVYGWGGLIDPAVSDLHATLAVACGEPGAGPPARLDVTYEWSWDRASPLPNGADVVVIGWTGDDDAGRPLYLVKEFNEQGPGIDSGQQNEPSRAMALAAEAESKGSWHWGIELAARGFEPGHIDLPLGKVREGTPGAMTLTIKATYIHLGIWRSDTEVVTCSW
jgi:hypothetical protein